MTVRTAANQNDIIFLVHEMKPIKAPQSGVEKNCKLVNDEHTIPGISINTDTEHQMVL